MRLVAFKVDELDIMVAGLMYEANGWLPTARQKDVQSRSLDERYHAEFQILARKIDTVLQQAGAAVVTDGTWKQSATPAPCVVDPASQRSTSSFSSLPPSFSPLVSLTLPFFSPLPSVPSSPNHCSLCILLEEILCLEGIPEPGNRIACR